MSILNQISVTTPSTKSPAAFFTSFLVVDKIQIAYKNFLDDIPNTLEEDHCLSNQCVTVSPSKDRFTIEYFYDVYDETGEYLSQESTVVEFTFGSELEKIFREKYQEFKILCKKKFANLNKDGRLSKSQKEYIRDLQFELVKIGLYLEKSQILIEYLPVFLRPLYAIIRFLYEQYREYSLDPSVHDFIKRALESNLDTLYLLEKSISVDAVLSIFLIKDYDGTYMFSFDSRDTEITEKLNNFFVRDLDKITSPIQIFGDSMKVNYLIHKLCSGIGLEITKVAKHKIFKNNNTSVIPNLCYSDASRISKMVGSPKDFIDLHFSNIS